MISTLDEITLELSRLERRAFENVRKRNAEQQLGEAWVDLLGPEHAVESRSIQPPSR
jgi:hypothetical protein